MKRFKTIEKDLTLVKAYVSELEGKIVTLKDMLEDDHTRVLCARTLCTSESCPESVKTEFGWQHCDCCDGWVCKMCLDEGYNTESGCLAEEKE